MTGEDFALVVVNYGAHHLIEANLPAATAEQAGAQVFLVDNFSTDPERRAVTELCARRGWTLVAQAGNPGFAAGVNSGVRAATRAGLDTFVTLNPDATADAETLADLARGVREDPGTAASPLVLTSGGRFDYRGSTVSLRTGRIRTGWVPGDDDAEWKNWLTGACLAFGRETFVRAQGLGTRYFLYWEDVDFSRRVVEAGGRLVLRRDLRIIHDEGGTHTAAGSRAKSPLYYYYNCRNRLLFGRRFHRGNWGGWIMSTPQESTRIWMRGGRRQLLTSPAGAVAAIRGSLVGIAASRPGAVRGSDLDDGAPSGAGRSGARRRDAVRAHPGRADGERADAERTHTGGKHAGRGDAGRKHTRRAEEGGGDGEQKVNRIATATGTSAPEGTRTAGPRPRTILVAHPSADLYGSDRVLLESVSALVGSGARVVVAVPGQGPLCAELFRRGATVVDCPTPVLRKSALSPRGLVGLSAQTGRGVVAARKVLAEVDPDLVLVNTLTIPLWLPLARARKVPTLCHVHEAEQSLPALVRRGLTAPLLLATHLVTNSRFSLGVLTGAWDRLGERTAVVHNGVPGPERVTLPRTELGEDPVNLLFVGRLSPRKGPQVALAALAHLKDMGHPAHLRLLGAVFPGYEWFEEELRAQVRAEGLGEHVEFLGFDPDIWGHMDAADIILVPSTVDEPFGNTAVEAMLAQRPLVVSATSGLKEAASGYAAVRRVPPGDVAALARAVVDLVRDWRNVVTEVEDDRELALARHAPELYRRRFVEEVEQLLPVGTVSGTGGTT